MYHRTDNVSIGRRKKKLSEISITGNKITQEPDNKSKKSKVGSRIDETKIHVELTPPPNTNKQDYAGGTNYKTHDSHTRESGNSQSETDVCSRNFDEEHKNEEDDYYIDPPSLKKDRIESKLQEEIRNGLLSKTIPFKVIKVVMFHIDNHDKEILAVGYKNKTIETKDKWNQLNIIYIQL